jgi:cytochrome c-type biogenesis protein CcmH/NrfF
MAVTAVSNGAMASTSQNPDGASDGSTGSTGPTQYHPAAVKAIGELFSPYCPGYILSICPSPTAAILRDSINALAEEGWSSGELVEWMVGNHGEQYRAVPLRNGWGIWAWILPPAGLLLGLTVIVLFLRHKVRSGAASGKVQRGRGAPGVVSSEEEEKLRSAIREIAMNEDPSV